LSGTLYTRIKLNFVVDVTQSGRVAAILDFRYMYVAYYLFSSTFARWRLCCWPWRRYAL